MEFSINGQSETMFVSIFFIFIYYKIQQQLYQQLQAIFVWMMVQQIN